MCQIHFENEQQMYWALTGFFYGYPTCCVEHFIQHAPVRTEAQEAVTNDGHGFIPCPDHAEQILVGKITKESLITDRACSNPYPISRDDDEELDAYIRSYIFTEKIP